MKQLRKIQTDIANFQIINSRIKWKVGATAIFPFQTHMEEFCNDQLTGPCNGPLINTSSSKIECPVTWHSDCVQSKDKFLNPGTMFASGPLTLDILCIVS